MHKIVYMINQNFLLKSAESRTEVPDLMCRFLIVGILRPTTPLLGRPQVRAVYSHDGASETQLSFHAGDIINLVGEKRDGWQYGENSATHQLVFHFQF